MIREYKDGWLATRNAADTRCVSLALGLININLFTAFCSEFVESFNLKACSHAA